MTLIGLMFLKNSGQRPGFCVQARGRAPAYETGS